MLPEELINDLLGEHCWGQPVRAKTLDKIFEIDRFLNRIDSEFLDPTCEGFRATFVTAFVRFLNNNDFIQVSPLDENPDLYGLPKEWNNSADPELRDDFTQCMNNLNTLSTEAHRAYIEMIREVRKLLIVK